MSIRQSIHSFPHLTLEIIGKRQCAVFIMHWLCWWWTVVWFNWRHFFSKSHVPSSVATNCFGRWTWLWHTAYSTNFYPPRMTCSLVDWLGWWYSCGGVQNPKNVNGLALIHKVVLQPVWGTCLVDGRPLYHVLVHCACSVYYYAFQILKRVASVVAWHKSASRLSRIVTISAIVLIIKMSVISAFIFRIDKYGCSVKRFPRPEILRGILFVFHWKTVNSEEFNNIEFFIGEICFKSTKFQVTKSWRYFLSAENWYFSKQLE